jgi:hypothetical protein
MTSTSGSISSIERKALILRAEGGRVIRIPVDSHCQMLVNYRFQERKILPYPLWKVIGDPDAGSNHAAQILAPFGNRIKGGCCAEVHHDARARRSARRLQLH